MNKTAADDNVLLLIQLAARPLATPPGPALRATGPGFTSAEQAG
jgi:hypothetical protein